MIEDKNLSQLSARIEDLMQRVESVADPAVRANVVALLQSIMDLQGQALARVADILSAEGEAGRRIFEKIAADDVVGGLLLLYGFHPEDLQSRVEKAIGKIQEHLRPSGGAVRLLAIENGIVRIRVTAGANSCDGGAASDKIIEDFLYSGAPDVAAIEIERDVLPSVGKQTLVQLQVNASIRA